MIIMIIIIIILMAIKQNNTNAEHNITHKHTWTTN